MTKFLPLFAAAILSFSAHGYDPKNVTVTGHELPAELVSVGVDEHLGAQLDLSLKFRDDSGQEVPLGHYFHQGKPVLMAMVYYNCPSLCNYHLNGLTEILKSLKWTAGEKFEVVAISMDHSETPELALPKKKNYVAAYGRLESENGWHFLTGSKENVKAIADQLGFRFKWLEDKKQFAHAAVTYVVTPDGKISRYLHGIQPELNTLKLSLLEASNGKIGNAIEQVLMFCFKFDPTKNKYTLYAWNLMQIGAVMTVLLLAVFLLPVWWREQRR